MSKQQQQRDIVVLPSPSCWSNFRRYGIRPTKSILASVADNVGDWIFYLRISDRASDTSSSSLDKFEWPLFVFSILSSVFTLFLLVSLWRDFRHRCTSSCQRPPPPKTAFGGCVKWFLGMELILEDIPQFVMTAWITYENGRSLTPYAVFNLTTSSFNFVLNLLDMIEVDDSFSSNSSVVEQQQDNQEEGPAMAVSGV